MTMFTPLPGAGRPRGGTQEDLRRHNLGAVLKHLHVGGPLSRAELTARLQLNRSTIAALVAELVAVGLVRERPPDAAPSGAGRPSPVVEAELGRVQVLAATVEVDEVQVARAGLGGVILDRRARRLERADDVRRVATVLAEVAADLLARTGEAATVVGMGVAVPGVVSREDGSVRFAPNLGWVDEPFATILGGLLDGLPVRVANDANVGLVAEHRRGAGRGIADVVFLACGTGVGGGVVSGGRALTGAGGYAGELGHVIVRSNGRRCRCGTRGCLETEIGAAAVARALGLRPGTPLGDLESAVRALPADTTVFEPLGRYLGLGIATAVNLFNPRLLIVGGLLNEVYPLVADQVGRVLAASCLAAPAAQLQVTLPALGHDAPLIGAAEMVWDDVLADPLSVAQCVGDQGATDG